MSVCCACGGMEFAPLLRVTANADGPIATAYEVLRCARCGLGVTHPAPPAGTLPSLHGASEHERRGGRGSSMGEALATWAEDRRLAAIHRHRRPPGRLLDIGAGKGRFLVRAARAGWAAEGLDPAAGQVAAALAQQGVSVRHTDLAGAGLPDEAFDVVTAWHVLEHLPEPGPELTQVRRLLVPGGLFACEVPSFGSWQARVTGRHWLHLDVPRHVLHYTRAAVGALLRANGFEVLEAGSFSVLMGPFGLLQSALNAAGLPPNALYRRLRGLPSGESTLVRMATSILALAGGAPATVLEAVAVAVGRGSVIRIVARRM